MVDARTKLDIMYQDALGDVRDILDRVDTLKAELPAAADSLGDKLNVQTGHYIMAAERLAGVLQAMSQEIDRRAAQAVVTAGETAKLDIRQTAAAAAADAISQTVGAEIAKVVGQVNNAANNLVTQTGAAKHEILGAARSMSWGFGRILAMVIAGGCISGLVTVLGSQYLQGRGAVAPDQETARQIEAGRDFIQVLPQLDNATREKVTRLILKNRAAEQK